MRSGRRKRHQVGTTRSPERKEEPETRMRSSVITLGLGKKAKSVEADACAHLTGVIGGGATALGLLRRKEMRKKNAVRKSSHPGKNRPETNVLGNKRTKSRRARL